MLATAVLGAASLLVSAVPAHAASDVVITGPTSTVPVGTSYTYTMAPTNGLIGEWKLDETSGTIAVDTKNGYNATVFGGAAFVAGKLGNALNFNNGTAGTGGKYAEMPSNAMLDNVQEANYTISAWFYSYSIPPNDTVDNRNWAVVTKYGQHLGLAYTNAQKFLARHYLVGNTLITATSPATYALNTWHHVAQVVSKTAGTVKLYVNGTLVATTNFTANTAAREYGTDPFRIGRGRFEWAADGKVDQVRIYNRDLTATEVSDLYNEAVTAAPTMTTTAPTITGLNTATLNGSANPNGASATGWFRYSATNPGSCNDTFGTRVPATGGTALGAGTSPVAYSRAVSGLLGGTKYYVCAIASNALGTRFGAVQSFVAGGAGLRSGLWGVTNPGEGPGGDLSEPSYRIISVVPSPSTVDNLIALADQYNVVLLLILAGNRGQWAPNGQFDFALYEAKVRQFQNDAVLRDAINRRRVLLFVIDEANHPDFHGTISPNEVNQMGLLHKQIWPGALTIVRMSGSTLANGWAGYTPPTTGYTGLDYGTGNYWYPNTDSTFAQFYQAEKDALNTLNMGMVAMLSWWAGGIGHQPPSEISLDGVSACWDTDNDGIVVNDGTGYGYIVGIDQPAPAPPEGTYVSCGQLPTAVTRTVASPAWIKRWADVLASDPDVPFGFVWRTGDDVALFPGSEALAARTDFINALDHMVTTMASRTTWNGYRTPK